MTPHFLFRVIHASVISILSTNQESVHLPGVLLNKESYNMHLVPRSRYSVEEINSREQQITETTAQQPPLLYDSNHFTER